jgi:hypothetical protein
MTDELTFRIVTSAAELDDEVAATDANYAITDVAKVALEPSGAPTDKVLSTSLPEAGLAEVRFVEPVTAIATITLATLAIRFVNHWLKSKQAGVQIDTRSVPPTLSRIAGTPAGFVVVISTDGKATLHQAKYDKPEDLLPQLAGFFNKQT